MLGYNHDGGGYRVLKRDGRRTCAAFAGGVGGRRAWARRLTLLPQRSGAAAPAGAGDTNCGCQRQRRSYDQQGGRRTHYE